MPWWYQCNVCWTYWFTKENPQFTSIFNLCQLQMSSIGFIFQAFVWSVSLGWVSQYICVRVMESILLFRKKTQHFKISSIKALNLVKAVVTRWLSHGVACKHCRERYHIFIEALDDVISTTNNLELVIYRDMLLETETVYQIMFLEGVLIVTNILSLLLQSDKKDFS